MARAPVCALALALCCAPPSEEVPAGGGALVRVATWNVHDLFDEADRLVPPGAADEVPSPAEVEEKLARLAAVITRLDADVVFLQEVEGAALLARLAERTGHAESRLVEGADPRGIDVAVLSHLPVLSYVSHLGDAGAGGEPLWSRDCVEVHAAAGATRLVVVGTHLVSRLSDPRGERRIEQAARLREIADAVEASQPGAVVLAGGDLNDEPGSAPLEELLGGGAWTDLVASLRPDDAWTWSSGGAGRARLDYLLLARADGGALLRAFVASGDDVTAASDHRPVVADLWIP